MTEETAAVSLRDVTSGYGSKIVQKGITFDVRHGEIVSILGGSGCGKSTLLKTIIGLLPVMEGDVLIEGESITKCSLEEKKRILRKFGVAFQNGALFRSYTLAENIELPLREYTSLSDGEIREIARKKLELVGLSGAEDTMPADLSGGMVKRGAVARALALDPGILFLDEPSAGLDPLNSANLDRLILELRDKLDATVVLVTHELDSIFAVADRAVFLDGNAGGILAEGDPRELRDSSSNETVRRFLNRGKVC